MATNPINIPLSQEPIYDYIKIDSKTGQVTDATMNYMWLLYFNESWAAQTGNTYTANGMLYVNNLGKITSTPAATNGQLLIGRTGTSPALTTLTAGPGITIGNGPGVITISSSGSITTWSAGATGLTPYTPSSGDIVLGGTLNVYSGGTGQNGFGANQIIYGSGGGLPLGTDPLFSYDPTTTTLSLVDQSVSGQITFITPNPTLNNLLPPQAGKTGYFLETDGVNTSWQPVVAGAGPTLTSNVISVPTTVPVDYTYFVVSYLKVLSTFYVFGNVGVY